MEKINSKDNIRLALVVVFSVITLSFWNSFISQKQQEKQLIKEEVVYEGKKEISDFTAGKNNNKKNTFEGSKLNRCINLKELQEFNVLRESSLVSDLKNKAHYDFDFNLCDINSSQKMGSIMHINNSVEFKKEDKDLFSFNAKISSDLSNPVYTFNFLKKEFHDIIYVNEKNETQRLDVSKVKKNQELSFVDFFGISSNYFNFSVIKKDNKTIKIKITESETDVYLHIIDTKGSDSLFYVFAGGKDLNLLKKYSKKFEMPRFEGVLDLGFFSIIAKPILILLDKVNQYIDNFTISIILATLLLKLLTIPLLNSSFASSQKMKLIAPKITQLKEKCKDDKMQMNKEMMALYKEYKINPLSAMFPMLIQIPILFAFYKVLSNAFYLYGAKGVFWIADLSAPEGLSIFNLFGLLPFNPPAFLMIGPMSILMGASTWLQQKLSANEGMDESQKSLMLMMPVFLLFISTSFPAGLLIYWIFSNIFAILHQYFYNLFHKPKGLVKL